MIQPGLAYHATAVCINQQVLHSHRGEATIPLQNLPPVLFSHILVGAVFQPDVAHPCSNTHRQVLWPNPASHAIQPVTASTSGQQVML